MSDNPIYIPDDPARYDSQQTYDGSMDFDEFTDKMNELLSLAWGRDWGFFTEDEPLGGDPDGIAVPVITFDTFERVRSESHRSLDPILFDKIKDPSDPSTTIKLYRMWFDMEVDFKIFHTSNRESRRLMDRFERFLFQYKGYFKNQGISDIIFLAETKPTVESRWNKELARRNLRYLVRIERITTIRSNNLNQVNTIVTGTQGEIPVPATGDKPTSFIEHYHLINRPK